MNSFFALISRMRYIGRWGLMRNSYQENIQEHSHMVAVLAHALATIKRDIFGGDIDPNFVGIAALYHDAPEIFTGDLPTPIKYNNSDIMLAYKQVEHTAAKKLLDMLPEELQPAYEPLLSAQQGDAHTIIKCADKLSAYIKCVEERKAGNNEFIQAEKQLLDTLNNYTNPEVKYFIENFLPAFGVTLDELDLSIK